MGDTDLNLDSIRDFMILKGGRVTNHELVKHFKEVLTNPSTRDDARVRFKEYVNILATITREPDGGKQLVLKKRFRPNQFPELYIPESPSPIPSSLPISPLQAPSTLNLQYQPVYGSSHESLESLVSPLKTPYRRSSQDSPGYYRAQEAFRSPVTPPPITSPLAYKSPPPPPGLKRNISQDSVFGSPFEHHSPRETDPPPVPPRRRSSSDKFRMDFSPEEPKVADPPPTLNPPKLEDNKENVADDSKISVKERMQKFDRMASESALNKATLGTNNAKKRHDKIDRDEDDSGSVTLLDSKSKEWLVKCAQCDYQSIVKMAAENPKLVKLKGTALHWGAKHGNQDVIKLIAGKHGANVNQRTNGGFTALHIAMQYGHDDVYNLLVEVYGADANLRDYSGKKARQYLTNKGTTVSADTFRKIKARKKQAEKDLGFLRIGSLNVRVKRTTEAFSNFLGVGNAEKIHKNWGSADNLPQVENKKMPPPKFAPIKKRKSKRGQDFSPKVLAAEKMQEIASAMKDFKDDSDSDTAAGFGSSWQTTV